MQVLTHLLALSFSVFAIKWLSLSPEVEGDVALSPSSPFNDDDDDDDDDDGAEEN